MQFLSEPGVDEESRFPMAAMVDIIFLLLIFFVSTSVFYRLEAEMDITIPVAEEARVNERKVGEIIINVRRDGTVVVNQRELTISKLTAILIQIAKVDKNTQVILRGDAEAKHQSIMSVLDACAKAGIWHVSFAALNELPKTTLTGG